VKLINRLQVWPRLRMRGAMPPLHNTSRCRGVSLPHCFDCITMSKLPKPDEFRGTRLKFAS
jgi:hypothetical protein